MHYCPNCFCSIGKLRVPQISLPFPCTILLSRKENRKKSTVVPVPLIARDCTLVRCVEEDVPDMVGSTMVFPGEGARCLDEYTDDELMSIQSVTFLDCTWRQTKSMMTTSLNDLPKVTLTAHKTMFWRYQKGNPDTCLATVEAIYYFYADLHKEKAKRGLAEPYEGEYDNLLWFFMYNYNNI
jgi:DTW domain-containing protein YfiP